MLYIKEIFIMALLAFVIAGNLTDVIYDYREGASLTQTEKEVSLLLLKGLSFKEIAAVRNTLEKTVRQHAGREMPRPVI